MRSRYDRANDHHDRALRLSTCNGSIGQRRPCLAGRAAPDPHCSTLDYKAPGRSGSAYLECARCDAHRGVRSASKFRANGAASSEYTAGGEGLES